MTVLSKTNKAPASPPTKKNRLIGRVVANKMQKTVTVKLDQLIRHRRYGKYIKRSKRYLAHTNISDLNIGDRVMLKAASPISKKKRWLVEKKIS